MEAELLKHFIETERRLIQLEMQVNELRSPLEQPHYEGQKDAKRTN